MIALAALLPHIDGTDDGFHIPPPGLSREEEMQAARDEAAAAASAAAEALFAARLEQLAATHEKDLGEARQRWCEEEAATLAENLLRQVDAAEQRLADAMVRVLKPFVETMLPQAAIVELQKALLPALAADLKKQIILQGPENLVNALAARLAAAGATDIAIGAKSGELQAECNGLLVSARLAAWCDAMGNAMREAGHG